MDETVYIYVCIYCFDLLHFYLLGQDKRTIFQWNYICIYTWLDEHSPLYYCRILGFRTWEPVHACFCYMHFSLLLYIIPLKNSSFLLIEQQILYICLRLPNYTQRVIKTQNSNWFKKWKFELIELDSIDISWGWIQHDNNWSELNSNIPTWIAQLMLTCLPPRESAQSLNWLVNWDDIPSYQPGLGKNTSHCTLSYPWYTS